MLNRALLSVEKDKRSARASSAALTYASEASTRVALDAIQVHGGYGYMRDLPFERLARDAKLLEIGAGLQESAGSSSPASSSAPGSKSRRAVASVPLRVRYASTPIAVRLLERPNRYLVRVRRAMGGGDLLAHLPDPGRIEELVVPGWTPGVGGSRRGARPQDAVRPGGGPPRP